MTLVRDYLTVVGLIAGTLVAVFAVAKTPAGDAARWVYRHVLGDPVASWFRKEVSEIVNVVVDERLMKPNGGKSLADLAARHDKTECQLNAIVAHLGIEDRPS